MVLAFKDLLMVFGNIGQGIFLDYFGRISMEGTVVAVVLLFLLGQVPVSVGGGSM